MGHSREHGQPNLERGARTADRCMDRSVLDRDQSMQKVLVTCNHQSFAVARRRYEEGGTKLRVAA